ncbi:MAG: efflux RND transporter periplasmic adaptor subunit [Pseudomonadales bacterium]|nr:efflux RND transporter periplasmic adaptor subunit [Pseudomonadales bacterium]
MALDTNALKSLRIDRSGDASRYESGRRYAWWIAAALVSAALAVYWLLGNRSVEVTTVTVEAPAGTSGSAVLNASGYVVARRLATVSSKVTGRITDVLIEEGASVKEGQLLARLDPATPEAQVELAERELAAAGRALAETRVRLAEARRQLARTAELQADGLVSAMALDSAQADAAALAAHLGVLEAQRKVAAATVALRRQDLTDLDIRAPFAGVVISKDAQPGEMVSPISAGGGFTRTGIATIVDMDSREIEVDVNEAFINRVSSGQRVEAVLDSYPDKTFGAHVINIVPTADRQKATVRVRIAFDELDPRILPDMGIKVRFLDGAVANGGSSTPPLTIPADAVARDGRGAFVWVVSQDRLERRAVTAGDTRNGRVVIAAGVRAGEEIVAPVTAKLQDGDLIRRKTS